MATKKNIAANLRKRNLQNSKNSAVLKKGMELPINTLVVVAIAVIVILAIAAFFMGGFGGSSKDIQNRQAFLNVCSGWTQTGCAAGDMPFDLEEKFKVWQPSVEISTDADEKRVFLASKCGCYGVGTPSGTKTLCSQLSADNCKLRVSDSKEPCDLMSCSDITGTCENDADSTKSGIQCPTGKIVAGNDNKGCTAATQNCCRSTPPASVCKIK